MKTKTMKCPNKINGICKVNCDHGKKHKENKNCMVAAGCPVCVEADSDSSDKK